MEPALPVVIVAEYPTRTVGFSRLADSIADGLAKRGWQVDYVGFYSHIAKPDEGLAYRVHAASWMRDVAGRVAQLADGESEPLTCIFFGRATEIRELAEQLIARGVRAAVDLTYYLPVDFAPTSPLVQEAIPFVDRIIPATELGHALLTPLAALERPIRNGVDLDRFKPLEADKRREHRQSLFGVDDETPVIGTFSRNTVNKRFDLMARVIAHLAHGSWASCGVCESATVAPIRLDGRLRDLPSRCDNCGRIGLAPAEPLSMVWQVHTEQLDAAGHASAGGWDLPMLIERYDLDDVVWWDRTRPFGKGVPIGELVARMASCDAHLLLSDAGGWELTMLETAACGVPNVIPRAGAFIEHASPFSEVVSVQDHFIAGHQGVADVGAAVASLHRLVHNERRRKELSQAAIQTAGSYSWDRACDLWDERLRSW